MTLNTKQALQLQEVVNYILEFEEYDYIDWCRETGMTKQHVYYHALMLEGALEEYKAKKD